MDNEIKGTGSSINFKYRMHDPRIGRFFALDPLAKKYPWNSPYAFSENSVIAFVELEGLEKVRFMGTPKTIDISNINDKEVVKQLFESLGFRFDEAWFDEGADDEYWEVRNGVDFWRNPTGTYIEKYASEASYKEGRGTPYFEDADRNFVQWLAAKGESLDGRHNVGEGLKLMAYTTGLILSGGSLALFEVGVGGIVLAATNAAVTLDDISKIGDEDSFLEEVAREIGDDEAVKGLGVAKVTSTIDASKGLVNIAISLKNGNTVKATYDAINAVWTETNVIISATQADEEEEEK